MLPRSLKPEGLRAFVALLGLLAVAAGCVQQQTASGPFPRFTEFEGELVQSVGFSGEIVVPGDSLRAVIQTRESRCRFIFLPVCIPGTSIGREDYALDLAELASDIVRIQLYHRDHGYYGARVEPDINEVSDGVDVEFFIDPGRQVMLTDLQIQGADTILDAEAVAAAIPLEEGEPFGRVTFLASADSIRQRLLRRGYAYADVLRNYSIDTIAGAAQAEFVALPGPLVFVDTIIVEGNERLSESTVRSQLNFTEGEVLQATELNESQRNLYSLAMIDFASIRLDDDEPDLEAETQQATVRVQMTEAPQYAVETSAGFSNLDCGRASAQWTNRNFLGAARQLQANASVSRLGIGDPTDIGFGDRICEPVTSGPGSFLETPGLEIVDYVDYRLSAAFQQPSLLGTRNQIGAEIHTERVSEIDAYIRESAGGRVTAVRDLDIAPVVASAGLSIDRGLTIANPALLCVGFDTCTEADLEQLQRYRWSNLLSLAASYDRQPVEGSGLEGFFLRGTVDWSSSAIGSSDDFLRLLGDGSYYRPLRPGYLLAAHLQIGRFLSGALGGQGSYIPPEQRFYAGGPNSVRGYTRNALGPTAYIETDPEIDPIPSATGGTQLIVSSVELRFPSPYLGDVLSLAAFVDAGNVSNPGVNFYDRGGIRVTPGAGFRFQTPVGPLRVDLAYNPYQGEPGPLYEANPGFGLILSDPDYRPDPPTFLRRFRVQFGLGQAF